MPKAAYLNADSAAGFIKRARYHIYYIESETQTKQLISASAMTAVRGILCEL